MISFIIWLFFEVMSHYRYFIRLGRNIVNFFFLEITKEISKHVPLPRKIYHLLQEEPDNFTSISIKLEFLRAFLKIFYSTPPSLISRKIQFQKRRREVFPSLPPLFRLYSIFFSSFDYLQDYSFSTKIH